MQFHTNFVHKFTSLTVNVNDHLFTHFKGSCLYLTLFILSWQGKREGHRVLRSKSLPVVDISINVYLPLHALVHVGGAPHHLVYSNQRLRTLRLSKKKMRII